MYRQSWVKTLNKLQVNNMCNSITGQATSAPKLSAVWVWITALELISRAASSVGVMYRSHGPNTGSNPGGGQIQKRSPDRGFIKLLALNNCYYILLEKALNKVLLQSNFIKCLIYP